MGDPARREHPHHDVAEVSEHESGAPTVRVPGALNTQVPTPPTIATMAVTVQNRRVPSTATRQPKHEERHRVRDEVLPIRVQERAEQDSAETGDVPGPQPEAGERSRQDRIGELHDPHRDEQEHRRGRIGRADAASSAAG